MTPFLTISSSFFLILYGCFLPGLLDWENFGVCPDGVGPGHVANGVKGVGKGSLQCHYVPDLGCRTREVTCSDCALRAGLLGPIALGPRRCTRAHFKIDLRGIEGGFCT